MFLEQLPSAYRYAFEFPDATWFGAPIYELLEKAGVAFCVYEMAGSLSPVEVTADFVYVRLHGPSEGYQGGYSDQSLWQWADRLKGWSESGHDVYAYFNNDAEGHAPRDAARLEAMLADA